MSSERLPNMIDRRRLFSAIGAGVIAMTIYATQELPRSGADTISGRDNHEVASTEPESYPMHENIPTTVFWVGEDADMKTNDNIHNRSSVWVEDWVAAYGGVDDPSGRCGYKPCGFEPKENPFYFALPFNDYDERGLKSESQLKVIPWYDGKLEEGKSVVKNRWLKIIYGDKEAYGQWEDAGPFGEDDTGYVFGEDRPKEPRAGLDVSPAIADYLGIDGKADVSWQFVRESDVPDGPWKEVVTISDPKW